MVESLACVRSSLFSCFRIPIPLYLDTVRARLACFLFISDDGNLPICLSTSRETILLGCVTHLTIFSVTKSKLCVRADVARTDSG